MFQKSSPTPVFYDFGHFPKKESWRPWNIKIVTPIKYLIKCKDKQKENKWG